MNNLNNSSVIFSDIITDVTSSSTSSGTITIDLSNFSDTYNTSYTINTDIDINSWSFEETVAFENGFPEWNDFQSMCKEYPGLEKTFEHLKAFYKLCKDDWESKKRGEND